PASSRSRVKRIAALALMSATAACVAPSADVPPEDVAVVQPLPSPAPSASPTSAPSAPSGPGTFLFDGSLEQGGWIRGQAPAGTVAARLGDIPLILDAEG